MSSDPNPSIPISTTPKLSKLRKIPHIPRTPKDRNIPDHDNVCDHDRLLSSPSEDEEAEEEEDGEAKNDNNDNSNRPSVVLASSLGLNHIRTRSALSPLRTSFPSATSPPPRRVDREEDKGKDGNFTKFSLPHHTHREQGKKMLRSQEKSLKEPSPLNSAIEGHNAALAKEMQSPRFQAILRLTSGGRKKAPDIKSFSHEFNSKGVKPYPFWKPHAFAQLEALLVVIMKKFEKLKEEVNYDLGIFGGDLVGILEKRSDSHPEWRVNLEDLLLIARKCAKMSPNEFWLKCEGIVQNLDDKRQELPMGTLKQAHTRLLFILTRCTRLVQFHKESSFEEDRVMGSHQLSDLGVYSEGILAQHDFSVTLSVKEVNSRQVKKSHKLEPDNSEATTAKSADSTTSSYRMSSWKKLPSAAEKNQRKGPGVVETPSNDGIDQLPVKDGRKPDVYDIHEHLDTFQCPYEPSDVSPKKSPSEYWDQPNITYENVMICRICEIEIPTVHVEEHSRLCTIADRCDLKGLSVNERLERVAVTLERILDSWTAKSTPKSVDNSGEAQDVARLSTSSIPEEMDEMLPRQSSLSVQYSEPMLDCAPEYNTFEMDDINILPDFRTKTSSGGSLTPRSPLLTPRTSHIELLLGGQRVLSEHESYEQINKLLDLARSVANVNGNEYSTLEFMLDRLEELKYAIQDRKVDALVVETFGRGIEKLLQEKYVLLCAQIEDQKLDSSHPTADDESPGEEDTVRSLRASPNPCPKDRTSIEDFEIIKPISRGAFGRVFLASKRATGDLFAIKVLKKADTIRKNAVESILAERNILISVRNPFVVRFYYSFTCRENLYLVMEYLNGGDLYSLLRNLGCLDEDMARIYIAEVVLALEYLHSLSVIHRDLKPDNLLIGSDGHIKLTDFGLSKVGLINSTDDLGPSINNNDIIGDNDDDDSKFQQSSKRENRQKHSVVGTPDYLAPEILLGMGHGATADWWSVGVILFELLVGVPPFNAENPQQIFDNIMNRYIPWPSVPEEMSYEAHDLINKLLIENPVQRLGATGAREVKQHPFFKDVSWDTLARQKAMFVPSSDVAHDTSYFMSRYVWNPEDEYVNGASDFDDLTDSSISCSSGSINLQDDADDEYANLAGFSGPTLAVKYSFSNFSFKNLSQLASINYDQLVKHAKESPDASHS